MCECDCLFSILHNNLYPLLQLKGLKLTHYGWDRES